MLTLRRKPNKDGYSAESTIDIQYNEEFITLSLYGIAHIGNTTFSTWTVDASDWGGERFPPKMITLADNQPIVINSWFKIYGSKTNDDGEAIIHLQAPITAIINRRDRT